MGANYFDNLTQQVNNINSCAELQVVTDKIMAALQDEVTGINAQIAALSPILALLTAPTSPSEVIDWVTGFINTVLTPQYAAAVRYGTQLTALLASIASLTTAIENAADRIPHCTVTIPPIT